MTALLYDEANKITPRSFLWNFAAFLLSLSVFPVLLLCKWFFPHLDFLNLSSAIVNGIIYYQENEASFPDS